MLVPYCIVIFGFLLLMEPTTSQPPLTSFDRRTMDNGYHFGYKTSDGTEREESGTFNDIPESPSGPKQFRVHGFYQYVDTNNALFRVKYVADDKGYQPIIEVTSNTIDASSVPSVAAASVLANDKNGVNVTKTGAGESEDDGLVDDRITVNLVKTLLG